MNTDISNRSFTKIRSEPGYDVGFFFRYRFKKFFNFQTGLNLIKKNYSYIRTDAYAGMYEKYTNTWWQVPVQVGVAIDMKKFSAGFNMGVFGAYWLSGKIKGAAPNMLNFETIINSNGQMIDNFNLESYSQRYRFDSEKDNRFDVGWVTSVSLMWHTGHKGIPFAACSYYQSLNDQQKKYMRIQAPKYNQTFSITIGWLMLWTHKK